ncbi:MAG TPA: cation:proton antiporter [Candidatus Aenigmarchaeota archaeon]|nr:cation:proton antiporter [Candidatus Aenigmarchaeota archaeon]
MEQFLLAIGLLILFAKIFGEVAERYGIASLVGEIVAGILLGPILGWVLIGSFLNSFLTFGIIFLLFIAGLEVKFEDIKNYAYKASFLAATGGLISLLLGFMVGMIFFGDFLISIAIGTVMISTSNGALFLLLMKTGEFDSKTGKLIVAITIADDVVGILMLSFFNMYISQSVAISSLFSVFLVSIGFYLFILTIGSRVIGKALNKINIFRDEQILFSIPIAIVFALAFFTNQIGLSVATGAFLAGMAMANSQFAEPVITAKVNIVSRGFLLPLFYASIGALLIFTNLNIFLIISIIIASMLGKFIGCGVLSKFTGSTWEEVKLIGISMMPRGDENIALLQIVVLLGVITNEIYTSLAVAIVITTILAPILMKLAYRRK